MLKKKLEVLFRVTHREKQTITCLISPATILEKETASYFLENSAGN